MNIKVNGITKFYSRRATPALSEINLDIPSGVFGLIGRNGAGKTTLLRIMATVLQTTKGEILLDEKNITKMLPEYRRMLGYLPQNTRLMPQLNIIEFLDYMCILKGIKKRAVCKSEIERCLEIAGLQNERKKLLARYSGGMLRRAGIAQALLGDPQILIIDEPTTGLDPEERLHFLNLLSRIGVGKNVVLSTHIIHDIENVCPNVCILEKGKTMYSGATKDAVGKIADKVWECQPDIGTENEIKNKAVVTNITYTYGKPIVRYVSDVSILDGSQKAKATLEDAYIYAVGGVSR